MATTFTKLGSAAVAGALLIGIVGTTPAQAQRRGPGGAGIAAGVIGGLAAGAIIGGALGGPAYARGPGYGAYQDGDPGCGYAQQEVFDAYGRFVGYRAVPAC